MLLRNLILAVFTCVPFFALGQYNTIVSSEILVNENTEFISLTAKAANISEVIQDIRYNFSVINKAVNGDVISNDKKEGVISLDSYKSELLFETTISKTKYDDVVVLLLLYNDKDVLLGKARWSKKEYVSIRFDNSFFQGLVTEDTRTKPGRDFYRIFFQEQFNRGLNADDIISVKEFIAGRRNTRIEVRLGNTLVANFFLQPREDYLKRMSSITLTNIVRVIEQKKSQNKQIEGY